MAQDNSLMTGLMMGISQGLGGAIIQKHQEEREDEQQRVNILSRLLQSGDLEAVRYFDEKTKKKLGFTPEIDQQLDRAIVLQRQQQAANMELFQEKLATSKVQRQAAQGQLAESQQKQDIISKLSPEEQKQLVLGGGAQQIAAQERMQDKSIAVQREKMAQDKALAETESDIREKQINAQIAQAQANIQLKSKELDLYGKDLALKTSMAETRADRQQAVNEQRDFNVLNTRYSKAVDEWNKILAMRDKDKKTGRTVPFDDPKEAQAYAQELTKAHKRMVTAGNAVANKVGGDKDEDEEFVVVGTPTTTGYFGTGQPTTTKPYHVVPKSMQAESVTPQAGGATPAKQGPAYERFLAPQASSGQSSWAVKTPAEAANATKLAVQAQSIAGKDPAGAVELLKKFMPEADAKATVESNLFDALIQTLAASAKKGR